MNPRMAKEFRVLLLPWSVALVIAIILLVANLLHLEAGSFVSFLRAVVTFAFFGCLLAIVASPFGSEFLHKTFPLLLS